MAERVQPPICSAILLARWLPGAALNRMFCVSYPCSPTTDQRPDLPMTARLSDAPCLTRTPYAEGSVRVAIDGLHTHANMLVKETTKAREAVSRVPLVSHDGS